MNDTQAVTLNAVALYGLALVLAAAFAAQLLLHELPCPLCLLQRILFALLAIGPILNIRFGPRPSHYALSLLTAVLGATVSTRQVLLHILPGDAGYGSALLGYHYYTGADRLRRRDRAARGDAAVRPPVRAPRGAGQLARQVRARCGVAGGRADGAECALHPDRVWLCRLCRQSRRL